MYTNKRETQFVVTKMARVFFCFLFLAEFHANPIDAVRIKASFIQIH